MGEELSEHDSEDSNREGNSDNDYPEERSSFDEDDYGKEGGGKSGKFNQYQKAKFCEAIGFKSSSEEEIAPYGSI